MTLETRPPTATEVQTVDARGLKCPMPIVRAAQAMKLVGSGELVEVLATDPGAVADFAAWSRTTGHQLLAFTEDAGVYRFVLQRK